MDSPSNLKNSYEHWEMTKDLIDQCIDITLNLSQSGHPGGSRSKVHGMLITLLSGAMRWILEIQLNVSQIGLFWLQVMIIPWFMQH